MAIERRERAEWEEALLQNGMDASEVDKRRELKEGLHRATENAIEAFERRRTHLTLLLEGMALEEVEKRVDIDDDMVEHYEAFGDEVRWSLDHLGLHRPTKAPPPPPRKARKAKAKRKRAR